MIRINISFLLCEFNRYFKLNGCIHLLLRLLMLGKFFVLRQSPCGWQRRAWGLQSLWSIVRCSCSSWKSDWVISRTCSKRRFQRSIWSIWRFFILLVWKHKLIKWRLLVFICIAFWAAHVLLLGVKNIKKPAVILF